MEGSPGRARYSAKSENTFDRHVHPFKEATTASAFNKRCSSAGGVFQTTK